MNSLAEILPVIIDFLLIILLVVGIILGIKLIITIDSVSELVEDVKKKVKSLDTVFSIVDGVSNKFSLITSKITDVALGLINKVKNLKKGKEDEEDYE